MPKNKNPDQFSWIDACKLGTVILVLVLLVAGLGNCVKQQERKGRLETCIGEFDTVDCLTRRLKETQAKEDYARKLKEIRQ